MDQLHSFKKVKYSGNYQRKLQKSKNAILSLQNKLKTVASPIATVSETREIKSAQINQSVGKDSHIDDDDEEWLNMELEDYVSDDGDISRGKIACQLNAPQFHFRLKMLNVLELKMLNFVCAL